MPVGEVLTFSDPTTNLAGLFSLSADGFLSSLQMFDYESYTDGLLGQFTVTVTDLGHTFLADVGLAYTDSQTITIEIQNVNEAPVFDAPYDQPVVLDVYENSAINTVIDTMSATDPDAMDTLTFDDDGGSLHPNFALSSGGVLTVAGDLDYEDQDSYSFTARVEDAGNDGPVLSDTESVTINILDAIEIDLNGNAGGEDFLDTWSVAPIGIASNSADLNFTGMVTGMTITIENLLDGADEVLGGAPNVGQMVMGTNITVVSNENGVLVLSGTDTATAYENILDDITYDNTSLTPDTTDRIITVEATDGNHTDSATSVILIADSFTGVGNSSLEVGTTELDGPKVSLMGKLFDPNGGQIILDDFDTTTANGGEVTVNDDGSFTYLPEAGVSVDSFEYTLTTNNSNTTETVAVNISLNEMVWYIDDVEVSGDGTSDSPFNTLADVNGTGGGQLDGVGDIIYISEGTYSGSGEQITLQESQSLIGSGVDLIVDGHLLVSATSAPVITSTALGASFITLDEGNVLSGFTLDGATFLRGIEGTNIGSVEITQVTLMNFGNNGNDHGIDLVLNSSGTVLIDTVNIVGGAGDGIYIEQTGAITTDLTITNSTLDNNGGDGIELINAPSSTLNFFIGSNSQSEGNVFTDDNFKLSAEGVIDGTFRYNTMTGTGITVPILFIISGSSAAAVLLLSDNMITALDAEDINVLVSGGADLDATITNNTFNSGMDLIDDIHLEIADDAGVVNLNITGNTLDTNSAILLVNAGTDTDLTGLGASTDVEAVLETSNSSTNVTVDTLETMDDGATALPTYPGPLFAAGGEVVNSDAQPITVDDAIGLMDAVQQYWADAGAEYQGDIIVAIGDLPQNIIGYGVNDTVYIDSTAAGYGWFVDPTPYDSSEFTVTSNDSIYDSSMAQMDLLTVLMHEVGHILGLGHSDEAGLMGESLAAGQRVLPHADLLSDAMLDYSAFDEETSATSDAQSMDSDGILQDSSDMDFGSALMAYNDSAMVAADSLQVDGFDGGGLNDSYDALTITQQEQVI